LAQDIIADRPSPSVDVSAMDGYAVRLADLARGTLQVSSEVRIGSRPPALAEGMAVKIVTGGAVPPGAEAVIKREDVREREGPVGAEIDVPAHTVHALRPGVNIRRRGENIGEGQVVASACVEVTPPVAAALACFGVAGPLVRRKVRVGVLVTGDELVGHDESPNEFQLRDSNGMTLAAILLRPAWIHVEAIARCKDDPNSLYDALKTLLNSCDAVILSGGVSMGDRDFIPVTIARAGAQKIFHRVPQRPGRPVLGAIKDGKPILALPGNPVSVMVTARRMVVPVLGALAGLSIAPAFATPARLTNADDKSIELWWQRPVRRAQALGEVELLPTMGSGDIPALAQSDGFIELPPHAKGPGPWPFYAWAF
jgi:molybdopterin molybdotransferase